MRSLWCSALALVAACSQPQTSATNSETPPPPPTTSAITPPPASCAHPLRPLRTVSWSPDGRFLAVEGARSEAPQKGNLTVFATATGLPIRHLDVAMPPSASELVITWSKDARHLITAGGIDEATPTAHCFDTATWAVTTATAPQFIVSAHANGDRLALAGHTQTTVLSLPDLKPIYSTPSTEPAHMPKWVRLSNDGRVVAEMTDQQSPWIGVRSSNQDTYRSNDFTAASPPHAKGLYERVSLPISPDGERLAIYGHRRAIVNLATGKIEAQLRDPDPPLDPKRFVIEAHSIWSRDGAELFVVSPRFVRRFDAKSGALASEVVLTSSDLPLTNRVDLSPDGTLLRIDASVFDMTLTEVRAIGPGFTTWLAGTHFLRGDTTVVDARDGSERGKIGGLPADPNQLIVSTSGTHAALFAAGGDDLFLVRGSDGHALRLRMLVASPGDQRPVVAATDGSYDAHPADVACLGQPATSPSPGLLKRFFAG